MKYSILLDKPNAKEPTFIFIKGTFGTPLKKSLKEKIHPINWNATHQRPEPSDDKKLNEDLKAIKLKLDRIANHVDDMIRESKRTGAPLLTPMIEKEIDKLLHITPNVRTDFFHYADIIYKEMESGELLTRQGKRFAKETLKNYSQALRVLREFKSSFDFSSVDMKFYRDFLTDMNKKDLSLNSIGCHIKCFRRLLNISHDRGWHTNRIYDDPQFITPGEQTEDVYLDESELNIMWEKHLLDKSQELCRDWFLLDAYTGLRISDIQQLNKRNLTKGTIIIANEKTDRKVEIPQHPIVKAILKKYKGLPPKVSDQEINREIKKVAELCKINETVLYVITKGGKRRDNYYKKYEMISNHTARRSFITNCRKNGVPDSIVMKLTGILKPQTLQKYDRMSPGEAAKLAADHSFFKG